MDRNHQEWYMSERPKKSRILVRAIPYSARYCSGAAFCKIMVPKTEVTAKRMNRKIVRPKEENTRHAMTFGFADSLSFKIILPLRAQNSRTNRGHLHRPILMEKTLMKNMKAVEMNNIVHFCCQPGKAFLEFPEKTKV